jgi:AcrR family transcriptional regulator
VAEAVKRSDQDLAPLLVGGDRGELAYKPVWDQKTLLPARVAVDGTSRRILLSALQLFGERGYHGVPVREIARGAGVRASSMYEYRASKEELLLDLVLIGHEEHSEWLRTAAAHSTAEPVHRLRELVRAHVRFHAAYPLLARVANRELAALSAEGLEQVLAVRRGSEILIEDAVQAGVDAGVFHVPHAWLAVAAIGGMGIRVAEWYGPAAGFSVEEVAETYAEFALRLLGFQGRP